MARRNGSQSILLPLIFFLGLSGSLRAEKYEKLGAQEQKKYFGTQPGSHQLSDSFAVDVDRKLMKFYFLGPSQKERTLIGVLSVFRFDSSDYGPREIAYAISADGKRLLYFDEPGVDHGKPPPSKDGTPVADLYRFEAGSGARQLIEQGVYRLGVSCEQFPTNTVRFGRLAPGGRSSGFAYSTEGQEVSLDERSRKLRDSGQQAKICGPL